MFFLFLKQWHSLFRATLESEKLETPSDNGEIVMGSTVVFSSFLGGIGGAVGASFLDSGVEGR